MSIALKKRPPEGVPTPSSQHVTLFVDMAGNPYLKDSNGVLTPATNAGNPLQLNQQSEAPAVVADAVKLYAKTVGTSAELFMVDPLNNDVQITDGGTIPGGQGRVGQTLLNFTTTGSEDLIPTSGTGSLRTYFGIYPFLVSAGFTDATIDFEIRLNGVAIDGATGVTGTFPIPTGGVNFSSVFAPIISASDTLTFNITNFTGGTFASVTVLWADFPGAGTSTIRFDIPGVVPTVAVAAPADGFVRFPYGPNFGVFGSILGGAGYVQNRDSVPHTVNVEIHDGTLTYAPSIPVSINPGEIKPLGLVLPLTSTQTYRLFLNEAVVTTAPRMYSTIRDLPLL